MSSWLDFLQTQKDAGRIKDFSVVQRSEYDYDVDIYYQPVRPIEYIRLDMCILKRTPILKFE
jgi:hypothetical protein